MTLIYLGIIYADPTQKINKTKTHFYHKGKHELNSTVRSGFNSIVNILKKHKKQTKMKQSNTKWDKV